MSVTETLSPEKQAQILKGAERVFARDGYEGASMSHIAAEAGVSKGTLYNYFDGKANLFASWIESVCSQRLAHIFDAFSSSDEPAVVLTELGHRMIGMLLSETGLTIYRLTISEARKFPELGRLFWDVAPARGIATLASWLVEQTAAGRLRVADPTLAAEQFFSLCQGRLITERRLMLQSEPSHDAIARLVDASVAMFLRSYGAGTVG